MSPQQYALVLPTITGVTPHPAQFTQLSRDVLLFEKLLDSIRSRTGSNFTQLDGMASDKLGIQFPLEWHAQLPTYL